MITYRIALFFVCVGVMSGIVGYIMEDVGGDNWFDQPVPDMKLVDIESGDVENLQFDGGSGVIDETGTLVKMFNILMSVLQGVFLITTMLDDFMVYDVNGTNLFAPVLFTFQIIIYVIYIIGAAQFISNRSIKVME
jgi:hypothetical protein